ncbi:hypothetical protein DL93DRAFT_2034583, partial [Clavulina sp. PMI_390]
PYYVRPGRGRKPMFDQYELCCMRRDIKSGRARDGADVHHLLDKPTGQSTVRRALANMGLHGRIRRRKPL